MTTETDELLAVREAADLLKVHGNTIRKWDRKGILTAMRVGPGNQRRFRKSEVLALLSRKTQEEAASPPQA